MTLLVRRHRARPADRGRRHQPPRQHAFGHSDAAAADGGLYASRGLCAAIAGIIVAADISGADANNAGLWLELDAILAVVVGGTSLLGGRFSIIASLVGAMIIQAVNTGILLSGFPPEFNLIIKAAIIVIILVIQSPRGAGRRSSQPSVSRREPADEPAKYLPLIATIVIFVLAYAACAAAVSRTSCRRA